MLARGEKECTERVQKKSVQCSLIAVEERERERIADLCGEVKEAVVHQLVRGKELMRRKAFGTTLSLGML